MALVCARTDFFDDIKRSKVIEPVVNPLDMDQNVIRNILLRVGSVIDKHHVAGIGGHKKMSVTVNRSLV